MERAAAMAKSSDAAPPEALTVPAASMTMPAFSQNSSVNKGPGGPRGRAVSIDVVVQYMVDMNEKQLVIG